MTDFITISNHPNSPKSKHSLHKACSLQQPSVELQESSSIKSGKKYHNLTPHSQQHLRISDQKSKYQQILKTFVHDNNFRKVFPQTRKVSSKGESQKGYILTLRALERKMHAISGITVLLKTQYPIIHNLVHKYFNYKFYNKEDHYNDIFLIWIDTYVSEEFVKRLKSYQRINHFPNSCQLGRKDLLTFNIKHAKKIMNQQYNFYPKTWILPKEYDSFCSERSKEQFLIVKPHANCQGRGIYLTKNPKFSSKDEVLVQEYIKNPMLLDGCKFDLRIYVLLRSLNPLRIFVYKQGLCRLATSKYTEPDESNFQNDKMHLTNYAINKLDPNFISNKDVYNDHKGHKRSYTSVIKYLRENDFDAEKIEERIDSIIVRTILAGYTKLLKSYKKTRQNNTQYSPVKDHSKITQQNLSKNVNEHNNEEPSVCFQLLGFDIMLLNTGEPILLEINHQPSLVTDSPFDMAVKKSLIMDTINLLNIEEKEKEQWQKCQKEGVSYRNKCLQQKELESMGGYRRIFPLNHIKYHNKTQSQIERTENLKIFYQTIMNKLLFREFKLINKIKINNYKTIASRIENRRDKQKIESSAQQDKTPQSSGKIKNNKTTISQNQKAIALTFYNLFNDAKYHIKKAPGEDSEDLSPEDHKIRNHIYLAEVDEEMPYPKQHQNSQNYLRSPYESPSPSRDKLRLRKQITYIKEIQQLSKNNSLSRQIAEKDGIIVEAFVSYRKFRDNITSIRNRGIISYISSECQKRKPKNNQDMSAQLEKCNFNQSPGKQYKKYSQSERNNKQVSPPQVYKVNKEDWKKMMVGSTQPKVSRQVHSSKDRSPESKQVFAGSTNEKIQYVNNIKSIRGQYQKLNFASYLNKRLQKSKQQLTDKLCIESKQTSPSAE